MVDGMGGEMIIGIRNDGDLDRGREMMGDARGTTVLTMTTGQSIHSAFLRRTALIVLRRSRQRDSPKYDNQREQEPRRPRSPTPPQSVPSPLIPPHY